MTRHALYRSLRRLAVDETAQDMVEYALLVAGVGLVGIAAWATIETLLAQSYAGLEEAQQDLWEPPDPL